MLGSFWGEIWLALSNWLMLNDCPEWLTFVKLYVRCLMPSGMDNSLGSQI